MSTCEAPNRHGARSFPVVAACLALAIAACSDEQETSPDASDGTWTIEDARAFDEFPLYWLGKIFEGQSLTDITRYEYDGSQGGAQENMVSFGYGTCTPVGDGGCQLPFDIRVDPFCDSPPGLAVTERGPAVDVRGALGRRVGEHFQVWTGDVAVSVFSDAGEEDALRVALQLRPVSDDGAEELELLPPPRKEPCDYPPPTPRRP